MSPSPDHSGRPHDLAGQDHGHDHAGHDHAGHDQAGASTTPVAADASVRVARSSDAPAVGVVQAAVWQAAYAQVVPPEVFARFESQAFAATWRRSLESPPSGAFNLHVACAGAQVVGFAAVGPSQDPDAGDSTGELLALGVHPLTRGVGHGSRLVNAAMAHLADAGATQVHAWVLATDEATRAFLHAAGFGPDGAHRQRVVGPAGETAREVRLVAGLGEPDAAGEPAP